VLLSLESDNPEVLDVTGIGDSTRTLRSRLKRPGSGGVGDHGTRTRGFPRNLGGTVVSTLKSQPAGAGSPKPRPTGGASTAWRERSLRTPAWYRVARETERAGRAAVVTAPSLHRGSRETDPRGACGGKGGAGKQSGRDTGRIHGS
jgi:hypothetical protein